MINTFIEDKNKDFFPCELPVSKPSSSIAIIPHAQQVPIQFKFVLDKIVQSKFVMPLALAERGLCSTQ